MPAVANRALLPVLSLCFALGARAESLTAIEACTKLSDDRARLACFDREVGAEMGHRASDSAPASTSVAPVAPAPRLTEEQKLGLSPGRIVQLERPASAPPPLKELTVTIQSLSTDANGHQVFTLQNGQVWRQVELDEAFFVHAGDAVTISRGALGSYFMSFGTHRNTRVTRLH
jgi:hypothetical protein